MKSRTSAAVLQVLTAAKLLAAPEAATQPWPMHPIALSIVAFLLTAMPGGKIPFVEFKAVADVECRLRNPWGEGALTLYRNGKVAGEVAGSLLRFPVAKDDVVVLVPRGTTLETLQRNMNKP